MAVTKIRVTALTEKLKALLTTLETMNEEKEEALNNAESAKYPNEECIDLLQEQQQCLADAQSYLEEAIGRLEEYE